MKVSESQNAGYLKQSGCRIKWLNLMLLSLFFPLVSCSLSENHDNVKPVKVLPYKGHLTEYTEDNQTIYNFIYDSDRLQMHNYYMPDGSKSFVYKYDSAGKPSEIDVTQPLYNYKLYPVFSDSVLLEFKMYINDEYKAKYTFDYDQEGRIIRVARISLRNGIIASTSMIWEGQNIKEYELKLYYFTPPEVYKYKFEYDKYKNPYKIVFRDFNFNFIEFLPISENNWTTMVAYNAEYPQTTLTMNNTFSYSGPGYPFVKLSSSLKSSGESQTIYSEYKY
jgi:hypothetical protein